MTGLILASGSATRASMLKNAGVRVEIVKPGVDEDEVKAALRAEGASPRDQADALAEIKALRVSAKYPEIMVIGADQVLDLNGEGFDKPGTRENARAQLEALRGKKHSLYSAAVIALDGAPIWRHIGRVDLTMRRFSDAFLEQYLNEMDDSLFQSVGVYRIEEQGAQLFSRVDGDWFTILGLPLFELLAFLRVRGVMQE